MPVFSLNLQKDFKLTIVKGMPEAAIETIDGAQWLGCCPLCGCTHQIIGVDIKRSYTPLCQTLPLVYKAQQVAWQKLHPDVAPFAALHLAISKAK